MDNRLTLSEIRPFSRDEISEDIASAEEALEHYQAKYEILRKAYEQRIIIS